MSTVTTSIDSRGVATLTLNRPEKHNALDGATMGEMVEALTKLGSDPKVRVVVLTGAGASFCAGADIGHMRSMLNFTEEQNVADAKVLAKLLRQLDEFELPTHRARQWKYLRWRRRPRGLRGHRDRRDPAKFALTEVRLGIVPAAISPYVVEAIGSRQARRLFLTAAPFTADEAAEAWDYCISRRRPSSSISSSTSRSITCCAVGRRRCVRQSSWSGASRTSTIAMCSVMETARPAGAFARQPGGQEGLSAFLERRKASWVPQE